MPSLLRRRIAWVMLIALVVAAMAPGISRALAFAQGQLAPWSVLCSAPGEAPMQGDQEPRHLLEHCAWCSLHGSTLAPPPAPTVLQLADLGQVVPPLFLHAPRLLPAWAAAQARAPPLVA